MLYIFTAQFGRCDVKIRARNIEHATQIAAGLQRQYGMLIVVR